MADLKLEGNIRPEDMAEVVSLKQEIEHLASFFSLLSSQKGEIPSDQKQALISEMVKTSERMRAIGARLDALWMPEKKPLFWGSGKNPEPDRSPTAPASCLHVRDDAGGPAPFGVDWAKLRPNQTAHGEDAKAPTEGKSRRVLTGLNFPGHILAELGFPKFVQEFTLHVKKGAVAEATCTFYPTIPQAQEPRE